MSDAPERIWATPYCYSRDDGWTHKNAGEFTTGPTNDSELETEYVRADRIAALEAALTPARNDALSMSYPACCVCSGPVDTREVEDGGGPDGCQMSEGSWVCSGDCYDAAIRAIKDQPSPAEPCFVSDEKDKT